MMARVLSSRRRLAISATGVLGLIAASVWLRGQFDDTRSVSELMPSGAILYLEAKDLHGLLNAWNNSTVKSRWLTSANYAVLAQSRLVQRLSQAQDEFAQLAKMPVGMSFVDQIAGVRSGFAFYNLSALRFVYLSRLPQNHLGDMQLWRDRIKYARREVAGIPFYIKTSDDATRTIAFASYKDWFLVATDENLAAATLALLSGGKDASIGTEPWFQAATKQASASGDLRLVYNLTALIATPQFRTYWLQRNATELKPFSAGISDLYREENGWKEERAMLRKTGLPMGSADESLHDVLAYAPPSASLYRAWSMPDRDQLIAALQTVIAPEQPGAAVFEPPAPQVTAEAGDVGTEADLEVRIDEAPLQHIAQISVTPLADAIIAMQPTALLDVQSTHTLRDQVFVMPSSGLVILCKQPDEAALTRALAQVRGPLGPGLVDPWNASVHGSTIVLSRINLAQHANTPMTLPKDVRYIAVYNHAAEWPRYKKLFAIIDRTPSGPEGPATPNAPAFFSGNLESIGDSLPGLEKASIFSADTGAVIHETLTYEFSRP